MSYDAIIDQLRFPESGLLPAIAQDVETGEILMLAWVNEEALTLTLETNQVHYWSRSRQEISRKGSSSGHTQQLIECRFDCDQDAILFRIQQSGPACHTTRKSGFYHAIRGGEVIIISEPEI